jgi:phosphoribosylanthranilate isomerase
MTAGPRVKVCGITRAEDAQLAVELGASAIGFVLWERSPRRIAVLDAARIAGALPPFVTRVGVVVDMPPDEVADVVRDIGLDAVQLHGDELVADYAAVPARLIKAVALEAESDVMRALGLPPAVAVLVDARAPTERGGTGQQANWAFAAQLARSRPVVLAGGLTGANVAQAVAQVRPWAVDVSSGVEQSPGAKSARRLHEFFAALQVERVRG